MVTREVLDDRLSATGEVTADAAATVRHDRDAFGRRVARRLNAGAWNWYFYNGLNVQAEGTGTANRTFNTTTGGPGGLIAREKNGTKYFYHYDRLGNVAAVTDGSGNLAGGYTMDAFGNVVERGDATGYSGSAGEFQPYHQTTKELDADTGLYYFNARWYDPALGRFVSRALLDETKEHPYGFCHASPTNVVDYTGQVPSYPGSCTACHGGCNCLEGCHHHDGYSAPFPQMPKPGDYYDGSHNGLAGFIMGSLGISPEAAAIIQIVRKNLQQSYWNIVKPLQQSESTAAQFVGTIISPDNMYDKNWHFGMPHPLHLMFGGPAEVNGVDRFPAGNLMPLGWKEDVISTYLGALGAQQYLIDSALASCPLR